MFTNKSFSNVGRKTAQSIDTLKKRLGVDAEATTKPTVATRALSSSVLDSSLPTGPGPNSVKTSCCTFPS